MTDTKFQAIKKGALLVARFLALYAFSWFITETLNQIVVIPEVYNWHVWEFVYAIPLRTLVKGGLTLLGMAVDKALHEIGKITGKDGWLGVKGLTGF